MTLSEFVLARYDEEFEKANARTVEYHPRWSRTQFYQSGRLYEEQVVMHDSVPVSSMVDVTDEYMAWVESLPLDREASQRRVEIEVLRHLVRTHTDGTCTESICQSGNLAYEPCETLKVLATVYASHPDYLLEWS